jgi:hypothetical protein
VDTPFSSSLMGVHISPVFMPATCFGLLCAFPFPAVGVCCRSRESQLKLLTTFFQQAYHYARSCVANNDSQA